MSTPKLSGGRFQQSDFSIGRFAAHPPAGTTLEDVMHPEYFQNHLSSLRAGMEITVLSEDYALDCKLRVLTVGKTFTKLRVLDVYAGDRPVAAGLADPASTTTSSEVIVKYAGPNHRWRYTHAGEVVEFGFATEDEAKAAADIYLAKLKG